MQSSRESKSGSPTTPVNLHDLDLPLAKRDTSKFALLYAQMHSSASKTSKHVKINFSFDNTETIAALHDFLWKHAHFIPHNVTLNLRTTTTDDSAPADKREPIKGKGPIIQQYQQEIAHMFQSAGAQLHVNGAEVNCNLLTLFNESPRRIDTFFRESPTFFKTFILDRLDTSIKKNPDKKYLADMHTKFIALYDQITAHLNPADKLSGSARQILIATNTLINDIQHPDNKGKGKDWLQARVTSYQQECMQTTFWGNFARAVLVVVAALSAAIAGAAFGLFAGVIPAAIIAPTAALLAGGGAAYLLFKSNRIETCANELSKAMTNRSVS